MTCISPGDCAVCQESIRDPFGSASPFFSDKVTANIQHNVRNVTENGRLQAISARPDGVSTAFRIIDPRLFILSVSFDL